MMKWGKRKADEMGVEMWLDATVYGVPLYKKHGFVVVNENNMHPRKENASEEWRKIEKELGSMVMWQMWRPMGGHYQEGKHGEMSATSCGITPTKSISRSISRSLRRWLFSKV